MQDACCSSYRKGTGRDSKSMEETVLWQSGLGPNCVCVCVCVRLFSIFIFGRQSSGVRVSFLYSKSSLSASSAHQLYLNLRFSPVRMLHLLAFYQSKTDLPHLQISCFFIYLNTLFYQFQVYSFPTPLPLANIC